MGNNLNITRPNVPPDMINSFLFVKYLPTGIFLFVFIFRRMVSVYAFHLLRFCWEYNETLCLYSSYKGFHDDELTYCICLFTYYSLMRCVDANIILRGIVGLYGWGVVLHPHALHVRFVW